MEVDMLDAMGTILAATAIAVVLTGVVTTMPIQLRGRLALAAAVGVWVGIAAAVAGAGKLANPATTLIMFTLPLAPVTGLALLPPTFPPHFQSPPLPHPTA